MVKLHSHHRRDLVCADCMNNGCSPGRYEQYDCQQCHLTFGSLKFATMSLKNFKHGSSSRLICQECQQKLKCAACQVAFHRTHWSKTERDNHEGKQQTRLVCKGCRKNGYNADDVKTYTCQECQKHSGWKEFDPNLMHNFKHHGRSKLLCKPCVAQEALRIKELQRKLKNSTRCCKCYHPIHSEK